MSPHHCESFMITFGIGWNCEIPPLLRENLLTRGPSAVGCVQRFLYSASPLCVFPPECKYCAGTWYHVPQPPHLRASRLPRGSLQVNHRDLGDVMFEELALNFQLFETSHGVPELCAGVSRHQTVATMSSEEAAAIAAAAKGLPDSGEPTIFDKV
eukprot:254965-Prorocentrum_minimum.AAC.2